MGAALSSLTRGRAGRRGGLRPVDTAAAAADVAADPSALWLIVGLGNPGPRYERTRHNVGWRVVDALAARAGCALDRAQCNAAVGRGELCGARVLLAKPLTFMNVSGEAVGGLARFYRIPPSRVIACYDDLDTDVARVRLRPGGGHGGHNGVRSMIQHFGGDKGFARVRVGIGRPPEHLPVASYVLQDFAASERADVDAAVEEAADAACAVLGLGLEKALSGVRLPAGGRAT